VNQAVDMQVVEEALNIEQDQGCDIARFDTGLGVAAKGVERNVQPVREGMSARRKEH